MSIAFDPILFILKGNEDMHKILDKFEFRPDRTTDYRVSCPWASKKIPIDLQWEIGVSLLARSFFIKSSGKLLVTRTGIKAQSSSILGRIRPLILELLALERRKFHTFELEYLWSQFANLDQILCVASLGWGKGCIRFWGRLTLTHWTQVSDHCPLGYLYIFFHDLIHVYSPGAGGIQPPRDKVLMSIETSCHFGYLLLDDNSLWKIHCCPFFPYKSLRDQIWPSCKIGQVQPRVIIWRNLVILEYPMLHTNFQDVSSGEEDS